MKKWPLFCLSLIIFASPGFCSEKLSLPCEVIELSKAFHSSSSQLNGVRYMLIHHANSADRETLSRWLKAHAGTEVTFLIREKEYKGVLFRLAHCFGRGLLVYAEDVTVKKRDIFDVILPLSGQAEGKGSN